MDTNQILEFKTSAELDPIDALVGLKPETIIEVIQDGGSFRTTVAELRKLPVFRIPTATGLALDGNNKQITVVDNTTTAAKTVTISNAPAGEAMTFIYVINGGAGNITWPGNIVWDKNTQPKPGTTRTLVIVLWDGSNFTGNQGSTA